MAGQPTWVSAPGRRVPVLPTTFLGWVAFALGICFVALVSALLAFGAGGGLAFLAGSASGMVALVAILRRAERAVTVFAALLPLALVVLFLVADPLLRH